MNSFSQIHSGDSEFKRSFSRNKAIRILSLTSPNLLKKEFLGKIKTRKFFFLFLELKPPLRFGRGWGRPSVWKREGF